MELLNNIKSAGQFVAERLFTPGGWDLGKLIMSDVQYEQLNDHMANVIKGDE